MEIIPEIFSNIHSTVVGMGNLIVVVVSRVERERRVGRWGSEEVKRCEIDFLFPSVVGTAE